MGRGFIADFGLAVSAVRELSSLIEAHFRSTREAASGLVNLVGMIFKSMEWRVAKLAAAYDDVQILMKKFLLLHEKLDAYGREFWDQTAGVLLEL